MSSKQYQDAYVYRNELLNGISNLNNQYIKYKDKLSKYEKNIQNNNQIIDEINKEIIENKRIMGFTALEGPGIKITLVDASTEFIQDPYEYEQKLIHNKDMIQVVNDLLNAGAEAISINEVRLISSSSINCNGAFLRINGIQICAPFYINAIGNKESLKKYILADENYLKSLMIRGIEVELEDKEDIKIPAYMGKMENKFIKSMNK